MTSSEDDQKLEVCDYLVVGGGIGGMSCVQELARLNPAKSILLLSQSSVLTEARTVFRCTNHLEEISVFEKTVEQFSFEYPRVRFMIAELMALLEDKHIAVLDNGLRISFAKVCLALGARPAVIAQHPRVLGLRDLNNVETMVNRIKYSRKTCVVGNGGIALELIHELAFCAVDWVIRDETIGNVFLDSNAARFVWPKIEMRLSTIAPCPVPRDFDCEQIPLTPPVSSSGYAAGPNWASQSSFRSCFASSRDSSPQPLHIYHSQEIVAISGDLDDKSIVKAHEWQWLVESDGKYFLHESPTAVDSQYPVHLLTSAGQVISCDTIVSATGLLPQNQCISCRTRVDKDGYILVNDNFETSSADVYAVGDCCAYRPIYRDTQHFVQMRLWSHSRLMGTVAAQAMSGRIDDFGTDTQLELFAHLTRFFGYKVVLLGRFNGQGLEDLFPLATQKIFVAHGDADANWSSDEPTNRKPSELEFWTRVTPGREFVKVVVFRNRVVGAVMIGDTDLEETMENLILNRLDVSRYGIEMLNPDIDIADYFD